MAKKITTKSGKVKKVFKITDKNVEKVIKKTKNGLEKSTGDYKLTVYINGECFETKTDDLKTAILELQPKKIVNKVRLIVEKGDTKIEKILFVMQARRVFNVPLATDFFVKNLKLALK